METGEYHKEISISLCSGRKPCIQTNGQDSYKQNRKRKRILKKEVRKWQALAYLTTEGLGQCFLQFNHMTQTHKYANNSKEISGLCLKSEVRMSRDEFRKINFNVHSRFFPAQKFVIHLTHSIGQVFLKLKTTYHISDMKVNQFF